MALIEREDNRIIKLLLLIYCDNDDSKNDYARASDDGN